MQANEKLLYMFIRQIVYLVHNFATGSSCHGPSILESFCICTVGVNMLTEILANYVEENSSKKVGKECLRSTC
jgi:hypothetical protein